MPNKIEKESPKGPEHLWGKAYGSEDYHDNGLLVLLKDDSHSE